MTRRNQRKVQNRNVALRHEFSAAIRREMDAAKAEGRDPERGPIVAAFAKREHAPVRSTLYAWATDLMGAERTLPTKGKANPNQARVQQPGRSNGGFTTVEDAELGPEQHSNRPDYKLWPAGGGDEPADPEASSGGALDFFFEDGGEKKKVRVVMIDGEPWFVGKDVAERLGYADPTTAIRSHCKGVQKLHPLPSGGGMQKVRVISEPDVMRLIVGSNLPAAQRFERWVFEDVLPSIRKTGGYIAGEEKLASGEETEDEFLARAFDVLRRKKESAEEARRLAEGRAAELEGVIEAQAPQIALLKSIAADRAHVSVIEAWHHLEFRRMDECTDMLIRHKFAYRLGGVGKLVPHADARRAGWVTEKTSPVPIKHRDGSTEYPISLRITRAGLLRLHNLKVREDAKRASGVKPPREDDQGNLPV